MTPATLPSIARAVLRPGAPLLLGALLAGPAVARAEVPAAAGPTPETPAAPTYAELGGLVYAGIATEPLAFSSGRWQGPPAAPGQPRVEARLLEAPWASGDLDGDGVAESAALVATAGAEAGSFRHLVIVGRRGGELDNWATFPLGDRVEVTSLRFEERDLLIDLVFPPASEGEQPSARSRRFAASGGAVREIAPLAALGDIYWHLAAMDGHSLALSRLPRTLGHGPGLLAGNSGCNAYRAPVVEERGRIRVTGPIVSMKRACASGVMAIERSFLETLAGAERLEYAGEELELICRDQRGERRLRFSRFAPKAILPKPAPPPRGRGEPSLRLPSSSPSQPPTPPPAPR